PGPTCASRTATPVVPPRCAPPAPPTPDCAGQTSGEPQSPARQRPPSPSYSSLGTERHRAPRHSRPPTAGPRSSPAPNCSGQSVTPSGPAREKPPPADNRRCCLIVVCGARSPINASNTGRVLTRALPWGPCRSCRCRHAVLVTDPTGPPAHTDSSRLTCRLQRVTLRSAQALGVGLSWCLVRQVGGGTNIPTGF